jgi:hypothetical protein
MKVRETLQVRVNDEFVLDAGVCEENSALHGTDRLILPPATTLFHQVLAYLRGKPDPPRPPSGSMVGREGVAAAALTLRWGSYLAVLLDQDKPVWSEASSAATSRISDSEMARINIEASAALAEWVDLRRAARGCDYEQLVNRAVTYLPMPRKTSKVERGIFAALAMPDMAGRIIEATSAERLERLRADAARFPSRIFANALINTAWRNGPVELIHAGRFEGYPLDQRRLTPAEERKLMASVCQRLAHGMDVCLALQSETPSRPWPEQVLPYGLAEILLVTPSAWTLTESSREVRIEARRDFGNEPGPP